MIRCRRRKQSLVQNDGAAVARSRAGDHVSGIVQRRVGRHLNRNEIGAGCTRRAGHLHHHCRCELFINVRRAGEHEHDIGVLRLCHGVNFWQLMFQRDDDLALLPHVDIAEINGVDARQRTGIGE